MSDPNRRGRNIVIAIIAWYLLIVAGTVRTVLNGFGAR